MSALHQRKDVTPCMLPGLFGGFADPIDWAALILIPVLAIIGIRGVRVADMEFQEWRPIDRFALFIGRVTMMLIISMTIGDAVRSVPPLHRETADALGQ